MLLRYSRTALYLCVTLFFSQIIFPGRLDTIVEDLEPTHVLPGLLTDKRYPSVISFSFEGFFLIRAHVEVLR